MRTISLSLCLLLATIAGAEAQQHETRSAAKAVTTQETTEQRRGLESIAGEAAEVGADDDAGPARDDDQSDGMATVEHEMVDSADDDGCTGAEGADCPGGDN